MDLPVHPILDAVLKMRPVDTETYVTKDHGKPFSIKGVFGWKDSKTSKIYTRNAQRSKLARQVIAKIDWGSLDSILPHPNSGEEFRYKNKEK